VSWFAQVPTTERAAFDAAVDATIPSPPQLDDAMATQFAAAQAAAKELARWVPGPKQCASLSGHANGVGDAERPGFSNDFVTVTVSQVTR
jgi:hypothetical protein